ncbi:glycosyltransferase family 2 protein [Flavicella sp.]|uniref:glycosyltransferase family 2 protein n=1 Tax=Flavicella sp. TaxID=2957742 RepID=UPI00301AC0AA
MSVVDVIIPSYKRPIYLSRAIDSVLSQTYSKVRAIVVDDNNFGDAFREETQKMMQKYIGNPKVIYLKHEVNKNGAAARNTGIRYSKADYIAFLDDDDFYKPDKIRNQVEKISNLDDTWGGVCCFHTRRYKNYTFAIYSVKEKESGNYAFDFLSGITSTPSSTLLVRRSLFNTIGLFDESFVRHQDLEFLMRFYRSYKMAVSPNYDVYMQTEGFRNYPNSKQAFQIKAKFLKTFEVDISSFDMNMQMKIMKNQWFEVACLFLKEKDYKSARDLFNKFIFVEGVIKFKDILRVLFFLISGYFPRFKKITSCFLGLTIYRKY